MDRLAFLRSLNFLRPLPHGVWDNSHDEEEPYSGSTITPPTPSKNNVVMVFEESLYAISIEPSTSTDDRINIISDSEHQEMSSRKRGRGDDLPTKSRKSAVGPAFFRSNSTGATKDVEPENHVQQENEDAGEADLKRHINSDPSLSTFEAAIMKKLPSSLLDGGPVQDSVFSTPNGNRHPTSHERDLTELKVLLFRIGNRFVFQVDESAIVELKYESHDGEVSGKDTFHSNTDEGEASSKNVGDESPPPKRQRNGGGSSSLHTEKSPVKAKKLPPSLKIAFCSCTFRVFSLESKPGNNSESKTATPVNLTPPDRIWGTLAKTVESAENRIMRARTLLMQHFEIENRDEKRSNQTGSIFWKMAPPGSGVAFESWPELFESSSFHSNTLKCKASTYLEEDWSHCLGKKGTIPSTIASPQKSSSTSKTSSSSTRLEHGQKDHTPTKDKSHSTKDRDVARNDSEEKNDAPNQSSELTHESEHPEKDDGAESKESQASLVEDTGRNGSELEVVSKERSVQSKALENGKPNHEDGASQPGDEGTKAGQDGIDSEDENANLHSWKDVMYRNYHHFEKSAIHMERVMDPGTILSHCQQNGTTVSHLTSCAESLSNSYLTANDFLNSSQQCENDVENVTSEMEIVLDRMFPARIFSKGRKSHAVDSDRSEDFQGKIEKLMISRREAVAAKFALLMTPKR